jgi:hypothetical protein
MKRFRLILFTPPIILAMCPANALYAETTRAEASGFVSLEANNLTVKNVAVKPSRYRGSAAALVTVDPFNPADDDTFAKVDGIAFTDFTLDVSVAGKPIDTTSSARGFVGIAFRVSDDLERFEAIYIRPTNGRADDQLRRNHSTQYISHPGYPWEKLRNDYPGQYESYVDLEAGAWTRLRLKVRGSSARLYVNGAKQPALIVNDLKLPVSKGGIGLWVGPGSEGYFKSLRVTATQR